jgi:gliding motility-associated-like protein
MLKGMYCSLLLLATVISARAQYDFTSSSMNGCTPMKVKYTFTSTASVDTITDFYWDFGNGQTSNLRNPDTVVYENAGIYTPALVYNNRADLMIVKPDLISVNHTVPANFRYNDTLSARTFVFEHIEPLDAGTSYTYLWNFESVGTGSNSKEIVTFPETDTFGISLTVSDDNGCSDTRNLQLVVVEEISVQNVFTPNGDNINDFFVIVSNGGVPVVARIFTRAGILVYKSEGTTITWDGITASGQKLNPGIYFYTIEALNGDALKSHSKAGVLYMYK